MLNQFLSDVANLPYKQFFCKGTAFLQMDIFLEYIESGKKYIIVPLSFSFSGHRFRTSPEYVSRP